MAGYETVKTSVNSYQAEPLTQGVVQTREAITAKHQHLTISQHFQPVLLASKNSEDRLLGVRAVGPGVEGRLEPT